MGVKNIRINQEKKENILSFEEYFDGFLESHEDSNGGNGICFFLWAARDISCEAPSVQEEAEAWYKSRKQTNKQTSLCFASKILCEIEEYRNDTTPISDFTFIFNIIFVIMSFVLGPR